MWPFDTSNREQMRQIQSQISDNSQRYKRVFAGEDGQKVLEDLAKRSFDKVTTYDPDIKKMYINEGRRSLFNYIRSMVEKDLTQIMEDLSR